MLLIILSFLWHRFHQHKLVGSTLKAQLVIEPVIITRKANAVSRPEHIRVNKQKSTTTTNTIATSQNFHTVTTTVTHQGHYDQLLLLLHNQVQTQINAMAYRVPNFLRNRTAKICFVLSPNGYLKNIQIQQSTKASILDQMAKQAVSVMQPIDAAHKYLHHTTFLYEL